MRARKDPSQELRDLIAASGLSRKEVAEMLGKTPRILEYWLSPTDERQPPKMAVLAMRWIAQETRRAS